MTSNQRTTEVQAGVFLENLATNKDARKLAKHIFRMFTSVGVISTDILSIVVNKNLGIALVHLRTNDVEEFVVKVFSDIRNVMNFYDVRKLSTRPQKIKVTRRIVSVQRQNVQSSTNRMEPVESTPVMNDSTPQVESMPLESSVTAPDTQATETTVVPFEQEQATTIQSPREMFSTSSLSSFGVEFEPLVEEDSMQHDTPNVEMESIHHDMHTDQEDCVQGNMHTTGEDVVQSDDIKCDIATSTSALDGESPGTASDETGKVIMVDEKTSTPQVSPCFCPETVFYHMKQHVGSESRHTEFKRGGVITDLRSFRSLVGKYLCAFLNTEGGTIYFGVTDDGKAVGITVDQRNEDQLRLMIDNAVSAIKPGVPTTAYSINFAKIMNNEGHIEKGRVVLEICVKPRNPPKTKHAFENNVYVRRDGSLRTL